MSDPLLIVVAEDEPYNLKRLGIPHTGILSCPRNPAHVSRIP